MGGLRRGVGGVRAVGGHGRRGCGGRNGCLGVSGQARMFVRDSFYRGSIAKAMS